MNNMYLKDNLYTPRNTRDKQTQRVFSVLKAMGKQASSQEAPARAEPQKDKSEKLPIPLKLNLSIREASEYSNVGINRLEALLREPGCPFVLFVGTKKLVKREAFEQFLAQRHAI